MKPFILLLVTYISGHQSEVYFTDGWACDMLEHILQDDPLIQNAECINTSELWALDVRPPNRPF